MKKLSKEEFVARYEANKAKKAEKRAQALKKANMDFFLYKVLMVLRLRVALRCRLWPMCPTCQSVRMVCASAGSSLPLRFLRRSLPWLAVCSISVRYWTTALR